MDWLEILKYIAAIASGLAAAIPLVIQLVKYIKQAVKEKNWGVVLEKVMKLMETAETKFKDGAERKEWVLAMLKASADGINYDIDYDAIADMIDSLLLLPIFRSIPLIDLKNYTKHLLLNSIYQISPYNSQHQFPMSKLYRSHLHSLLNQEIL